MHILFLTDNFPPEVNAPASRTYEHCKEWVALGHDVTVITCAPNFPKGQVFPGYKNKLHQKEFIDGIRVIRVWSYITENAGFTKRILDYLSFMFSGLIAGLFVKKVNIIVGTSPQFFTVCATYLLSIFKRKPWVFELRDIWPESIRTVGAMGQSRTLDMLEKLELFLYRRATRIVPVTHSFKETLIGRGIDGEKINVVTNGVDLTRFASSEKSQDLLESLYLQGKFIAGYIGTHGLAHSLDTLLDAAKILKENHPEETIHVLMLGDGANKDELISRAFRDGLENVTFVDSVSKSAVVKYWSLLDVSIIHLKKSPLFKTVIPSKLFECMGMGIPVAHGVLGESANIVEREKIGLVFEPENAQALVDTLLKLKNANNLLGSYKNNALEAAKRYDRKQLAKDMLEVLEPLASE